LPNLALPVPRQWSRHIKSAFIHTISLASATFTSTYDSPQAKVKGQAGVKFVLTLTFMENRQHLPVIELQKVA